MEMWFELTVVMGICSAEKGRRELLPEYLFWLLNTPKVKRYIYENTSGNMLGAIKAKYFSDFDIPELSIIKQQRIAYMKNALALKETMLPRRLAEGKERFYSLLMDQTHKELKRGK